MISPQTIDMASGLHGLISGRPVRTMVLEQFLDYVIGHDKVWICRRDEIAKHWAKQYPP